MTFALSDAEERALTKRAKLSKLSVSEYIHKTLSDLGLLVNQLDHKNPVT